MSEYSLHISLVNYMRLQYPQVRFKTALDGMHLSKTQAVYAKRFQWGAGFPDLMIYHKTGDYSGLALELKVKTPYKKNGDLKSGIHLKQQSEWLSYLDSCGFKAQFSWGLELSKELIDNYLKDDFKRHK